jgi:threonine dehydrogenase-like Zn-dependent dehydrogenase
MGGTPSIGLYVAMFAAAVGAGAIDYVDRSAQRRTQASALGATPHERTPVGEEYEVIVDASADRGALAEGLRHADSAIASASSSATRRRCRST